jgi:exopolysaccharide biosynthesis polyprenyl glycosylphosphotransferase
LDPETAPSVVDERASRTREREPARGRFRSYPELRPSRRRDGTIPISDGSEVVLRRDSVYRRLLALADAAAAGLAVGLAGVVSGVGISPAAAAFLPLLILVAKIVGLYDRDEQVLHKSTLDEAPLIFEVATLCTLLIWLLDGVVVSGGLDRRGVLVLWGMLVVAMLLARTLARAAAQRITPPERCLVIGDLDSTHWIVRSVQRSFSLKVEVVGRVPLHSERFRKSDTTVLGDLGSLGIILMEHDVHRVIIAPGTSNSDQILDTVRLVKALGVKVSVLPRLLEVVGSSVEFDEVNGMPLLGLRKHGLTKSSKVLKRSMDAVGSSVLLVLLAPALAAIALAVKLSSSGPVLFRQPRIGRDGSRFEMLKFRTMVDGADEMKAELRHLNEADGLFKIAEDPRLTRAGRFLRRASLDELPQLINVLRGEMSLVGPRPLVAEDDAQIDEGWQRRRLGLTPGMTGFWQILGSARIPLAEMVKIDYIYAANWSLWLDMKILLRTVPHVVSRRGL